MEFVEALVSVLTTVFTSYVGPLAKAVVDMFGGLFWVPGVGEAAGSLTILGQGLIAIVAIGLVSSIFYVVYKIFRGRLRKRL